MTGLTSEAPPASHSGGSVVTGPSWVIEPASTHPWVKVREVWQYRRLAIFFALRAVQKAYQRTRLGWAWLFIRPLFPLFVKTAIFGGALGVTGDGIPYFLFLVTASCVWELFAHALVWGTRSLEYNRGLLRQMYVPRLMMPLVMMTPAFVTFFIYLGVLAGTLVWFRAVHGHGYMVFGPNLLWAVLAVLMSIALAFSIALWTSVPALVARDVRFTVGYVMGFWVYLTPVMYPLSTMKPRWQELMLLNPMAAVVETFKFGILGIGAVRVENLLIAAATTCVIFAGGLWFFLRAEADAADRV